MIHRCCRGSGGVTHTVFADPNPNPSRYWQVHNLIAINGPQQGVGECPDIEWKPIKSLCGSTGTEIGVCAPPHDDTLL